MEIMVTILHLICYFRLREIADEMKTKKEYVLNTNPLMKEQNSRNTFDGDSSEKLSETLKRLVYINDGIE